MSGKFSISYKNLIVYLAIFIPVIFTAVFYFPELELNSPETNDFNFHLSLAKSLHEQINNFGHIDHVVSYWMAGYPIFHYYQSLPYLITIFISQFFLKKISLQIIMHFLLYLLMVLFPLSVYYGLRKIGFNKTWSAFSALFSLGISGNYTFGWEYSSYIWQGFGMWSQLFGMFLLPLALGRVAVSLKQGEKYFWSVFLLSLTILSHILFGYLAFNISFVLLVLAKNKKDLLKRFKRLVLILFLTMVVTACFWLPLVLDLGYHFKSVYEPIEKYNSFGYKEILTKFISGELLDSGRFAIITILCSFGLLFSLYESLKNKNKIYRFTWVGFSVTLFLYFGRATWGEFIDLLPMSKGLHMQRLVNSFHFFVLMTAGASLEFLWRKLKGFKGLNSKKRVLIFIILFIIVIFPVFKERADYLLWSASLAKENKIQFEKEWPNFKAILDKVKTLPPGRVYCGRKGNWGYDYKIGQVQCYHLLSSNGIDGIAFMPYSWPLACDMQSHFNEYRWDHYNLYNVRYIISNNERIWPDFAELIFQNKKHSLYQVKTSGFFDLVNSDIFLKADKETSWNFNYLWQKSNLLSKKQFMTIGSKIPRHQYYDEIIIAKDRYYYLKKSQNKEKQHVFAKDNFFNDFSYPATQNLGEILEETKERQVYKAKAKVFQDAFLLFKMNYHPNWHILINGQEQKKVILSPGLIGIKLEPGEYDVRAVYRPRKIKSVLFVFSLIVLFSLVRKK